MGNKIIVHLSRTPEGVGMKITGTTADEFAVLLASFKAAMPDWSRAYDPDAKFWTVETDYYPALRAWCAGVVRRYGAKVIDDWSSVRSSPDSYADLVVECALRELHLLPGALDFPELIAVAYKTLAVRLHPDHGGDHGATLRLNLAYEILSRALAA